MARLQRHSLAGPVRRCLVRQPGANSKGVLLVWPGYNATVRLASAGAVRSYSPAPTARERCWDGPATVARSGWPWYMPSGAVDQCQQRGGVSGVAWLWQHGLAGPGRPIQCGSPEPVERDCCRGGQATAALASWPQKAQFSTVARDRWRGSAGGTARLRRHGLAGTGICHPAQQLGGGSERTMPEQPSYGDTAQPSTAGAAWCGSPVPAAWEYCGSCPATVAPFDWTRQESSGAANKRRQRGSTVGLAWIRQHHLAHPGRRCLMRCSRADGKGVLPGQLGNSGTVWPEPSGVVWSNVLAPGVRGVCWGSTAMVAPSGLPWQAPSVATYSHWWQGCVARVAWLQ